VATAIGTKKSDVITKLLPHPRHLHAICRSTRMIAFLPHPRHLHVYFLFYSRDNAIHPQGICGLGKYKREGASSRSSAGLLQHRDPPPSAVRCAQVSGYELPLQKNVERKNGRRKLAKQINPRPEGLPLPPSPMPPTHPSSRHRPRPPPSRQPSPFPPPTAPGTSQNVAPTWDWQAVL
jgi:hypothetical protein